MAHDMLVKLYALPQDDGGARLRADHQISVVRAMSPDMHLVLAFVRDVFGEGWASECAAAFANRPISCYIAVHQKKVVGFACYDATAKDYFGPTGVDPAYRGKGVGTVLLIKCLQGLRDEGYAYAIIGGVGDARGFYERTVGAVAIEDSSPGIYASMVGHQ